MASSTGTRGGFSWSPTIGSTELIWHRANTEMDLSAFLASGVRWAECDARLDPLGSVRVSHEPLDGGSEWMDLTEWLGAIRGAGRSAKIDLKEGGSVLDLALAAIGRVGFQDDDVWLNAAVEVPDGEAGFVRLASAHPGARLSVPLDTLASYLLVTPPALAVVDLLGSWGVNWLCFGSRAPAVGRLVPRMQERGWPVNIWDVATDEDFERALSFEPQAITADLGSIHA